VQQPAQAVAAIISCQSSLGQNDAAPQLIRTGCPPPWKGYKLGNESVSLTNPSFGQWANASRSGLRT
jgi:hypothetical protein